MQILYIPLSREKVMVELGIARRFQLDLAVFFDKRSAPHDSFAGIELKRVARPVESDLPISTVSVRPSVRPSLSILSK